MRYTNAFPFNSIFVMAMGDMVSDPIDASSFTDFSVIVHSTGALTGQLSLEASNDGENWVQGISFTGVSNTPAMMFAQNFATMWVRFRFTPDPAPNGVLKASFKSDGY